MLAAATLPGCDGGSDGPPEPPSIAGEPGAPALVVQDDAELLRGGAPGIHFYTLNRSPATRAILSALRLMRPWDERSGLGEATLALG